MDALKKKQTITSTALIRLGTFCLIFSGSSWNGRWNNRPLRSFNMNSPLETLVHEVIRIDDKNTSRVEICTVCEYEHYPFFHCGSTRKALIKQNTSSVVGFFVVALYNTSNTLYNCCSNKNFKAVQQTVGRNFPSTTVKFPAASTRFELWGEPLMSLPLIRKPASRTRASNGGSKISTKTIRKKRLPVVVMS